MFDCPVVVVPCKHKRICFLIRSLCVQLESPSSTGSVTKVSESKILFNAQMENCSTLRAPLHPDLTSVQLDYFFYDCKPQARTFDPVRRVLPLKKVEYFAAVY